MQQKCLWMIFNRKYDIIKLCKIKNNNHSLNFYVRTLVPVDWEEVKIFFQKETRRLAHERLHI